MSKEPIDQSISRRRALKSTVALGLSATLLGCQETDSTDVSAPNPSSASNSADPKVERVASSHRVYIVDPGDRFFEFMSQLKPQPQYMRWVGTRSLALPLSLQDEAKKAETKPLQREGDFVVWATEKEAEKLGESEVIKSVRLMESAIEVGDPKLAKGKLAIRLFPNMVPHHNTETEKNFQSTKEVMVQWKQKLASVNGLKLSIPASKTAGQAFGDIPEAGQVLIEFDGDELDPHVLSVIKSHPQTVAFQWGDVFRFFYCPGCGMG